jgi:hypothetical protein
MKMKRTLTTFVALAAILAGAPAGSSAPAVHPLLVHGGIGHLIAPGDRVEIGYQVYTAHVKSPVGTLYARNDLQKGFQRLPLKLTRGGLRTAVPKRLVRGRKLFYYAVIRDPQSGRSATLPSAGARSPASAWILDRAVVVRLGTHSFGHTRAADAVVARAGAGSVGFENNENYQFGPQTFLVGRDGSVWLHDGLNQRLLVWPAGHPDAAPHVVQLPFFAGDNDIALGPAGSVYVTRLLRDPPRLLLYRLSPTGKVLWKIRLAGTYAGESTFVLGSNSPLRVGPNGTLYCLVFMGQPGDEWGWMPVATPSGSPLSAAAQRRGTNWPYQPASGGLRLLAETYTPPNADTAPHEHRFALVDRHGRLVRAWRVLSRSDFGGVGKPMTPELVGHDLVVALPVTTGTVSEYTVLRLGAHGAAIRFSLPYSMWGSSLLSDLRIGPDHALYQLSSSPTTGVVISRYSLGL